jgi:iron complex transport system ATP-binding protein
MNCQLELLNATVRYGTAEVLRCASLKFYAGEFVAIAGPNGAGKSTLLSLAAGLTTPSSGQCLLEGRETRHWPRREFARRVGVVMQSEPTNFPFTAEDVVYMGRMPHAAGLRETADDHLAVANALAATGTGNLRLRDFRTLSGGERQRVVLASALAQQPQVLLLDEPANHLDLQHQLALHRLLRELSSQGLLVIAVTHDLNLAAAYAGRIVLMNHGLIVADGAPAEVLASGLIQDVFQVNVEVHAKPSGQPWLVYGE